jgi:Transposase DDE domain
MRSLTSLRSWMEEFLPSTSEAAREGAWQLVRALMANFAVSLCGLARQVERGTQATSARQYLFRWLCRPHWQPSELYARLPQVWPRELRRAKRVLLLMDCTILGEGWCVLQVSLPWQGRALPVYRVVVNYRRPEAGQTELVHETLAWLKQHLPGPLGRYVVVMDRGFPSHLLIRALQEEGWRYVLRIGSDWRMTHADYSGLLGAVFAGEAKDECHSRWFGDAVLGSRRKGRERWSSTHVVAYSAPEHQEIWVLATSEGSVQAAVSIYRQRMQIEAEFRDLKGPLGLDHLERWKQRERVARLLAWLAVYEWRLALLWLCRPLASWGRKHLQAGGRLSWITITREWVKRQLRAAIGGRTLVRESL